jgi:hypothetical protein
MEGAWGKIPASEILPKLGLNPTVAQQADGIRLDPPLSVPTAKTASPAASPAALPPLVLPPPGPAGAG